jgi:putative tricarboxylic transport membrane protein
MQKVRETPEWKDFIKRGAYSEDFLTGKGFAEFLTQDEKHLKDVMQATGLIAK